MKKPLLYSIVLNWNSIRDTSLTLESLKKQDYPRHHILLVDNNSKEEVRNKLKEDFPNIEHIFNQENCGWAGGNNVGIEYALSMNADFVLLVNNDIFLEDISIISRIIHNFNQFEDRFHIQGPCLMDFYKKDVVQQAGTTIFHSINDRHLFNNFKDNSSIGDTISYFDGVPGAFMAIKSDIFSDIGFFDEKFFMYGEETDFCYRAWLKNIKSVVDNELLVYHKGAASTGQNSPFVTYYKTRNLLYLIKKHKNTIEHYKFFLFKYFKSTSKSILRSLYDLGKKRKNVSAIMHGIWDGLTNNLNKSHKY